MLDVRGWKKPNNKINNQKNETSREGEEVLIKKEGSNEKNYPGRY